MTTAWKWLKFLCLILFVCQNASTQDTCHSGSFIGSTDTIASEAEVDRSNSRLYLNAANPAPCNGTVTTWTYCYYSPESEQVHEVYFTTYTKTNNINGLTSYTLRSERSLLFTIFANRTSGINFSCTSFSPKENVTILEGDIIGVCLRGESEKRFGIVSETSDEQDELLYRGCRNRIPTFILEKRLTKIQYRLLHLSAEIISNSYQMVSVSLPTASMVASTGANTASNTNASRPTNTAANSTVTSTGSVTELNMKSAGHPNKLIGTTGIIGCIVGASIFLILIAVFICALNCIRIRRHKRSKMNNLDLNEDDFNSTEVRIGSGYYNFRYLSESNEDCHNVCDTVIRERSHEDASSTPAADSDHNIVTNKNLAYLNPLLLITSPNVAYSRNDFISLDSNEYAYIHT